MSNFSYNSDLTGSTASETDILFAADCKTASCDASYDYLEVVAYQEFTQDYPTYTYPTYPDYPTEANYPSYSYPSYGNYTYSYGNYSYNYNYTYPYNNYSYNYNYSYNSNAQL